MFVQAVEFATLSQKVSLVQNSELDGIELHTKRNHWRQETLMQSSKIVDQWKMCEHKTTWASEYGK